MRIIAIPARTKLCARWEVVKVLEVFIREGVSITGGMHSETDTVMKVSECFKPHSEHCDEKKVAAHLFFLGG